MSAEKKLVLISTGNAERDQHLQKLVSGAWRESIVFLAGDGNQVLLKAEKAPPHLFLLSATAAKPSGLEIYERLKSDKAYKKATFIVLLGEGQKVVMNDDSAVNRAFFIAHPGEDVEVLAAMTKVLNFLNQASSDGSSYKSKFVKKGEFLIRFGEQPDFVYILVKGRLQASVENDGARKVLGYIEPGEFVGEMSYINNEIRSADVTADQDSELLEISIHNIDSVLYQKPAWAKAMIKTLSRRLKGANTKPR